MTDNEVDHYRHEMLELLRQQKEQMDRVEQMSERIDIFLMQPRAPGKPSRASELDDLLGVARDGTLAQMVILARSTAVGGNAFKWLAGVVAAVGAVIIFWRSGWRP